MWGFASCSITCPDGNVCSDFATCCMTEHGYSCCPYPNAVCCSDLAHCCPSGFHCNQVTQVCEKKPWMQMPMVKKEAAEEPSTPVLPVSLVREPQNNHVPDQEKSSIVHCDNYYTCPDATTCCRHPTGLWFCCPYSPGRCCLDGFHCCPYGFDCDPTYRFCLRQGLRYPFTPKQSMPSFPASLTSTSEDEGGVQQTPLTALTEAKGGNGEAGVIRCDSQFYCKAGTSCCKGAKGQWSCCPYKVGACCADGRHCCAFGFNCDPDSMSCKEWYSQTPSGAQEHTKRD